MRVSRERVAENRRAILEAAGRLFRERGFESVTVAEIMQAAGMTHGGFYGYFRSKEDLIAAALADSLSRAAVPSGDLSAYAALYLSRAHRDDVAGGCPMAALAAETARQKGGARAALTAGLKQQLEHLTRLARGKNASENRRMAIGSWAAMLGAIILARVSDDPAFSDEVLDQTRTWLADLAGGPGKDQARPRSRKRSARVRSSAGGGRGLA